MIKVGITGSIASGKTTASKIISYKKGPLFSADRIVKKLYSQNSFKKLVTKKFNLTRGKNFKKNLKIKILKKELSLKKLEKLIHPLVRREMYNFQKKNKHKKFLFFEIPLLIESKLKKHFNVVLFIKSKKNLRLKRYVSRGGNIKLFKLLNDYQLKDSKKAKFCNHIFVNNGSLAVLKKNLLNIIKLYE